MTLNQQKNIQAIASDVELKLNQAEAGHDWWHIVRVWRNAKRICLVEQVDQYVVEIAALLHDIADAKFHDGDESIGPKVAIEIMSKHGIQDDVKSHVVNIIENMSFKNSFEKSTFSTAEMRVLQDADRLDAIGAIGIARAFSYGGYKGRSFMDPSIAPEIHLSKESYKKTSAPTINHFYEKLLLLKDGMHTEEGKKMAKQRHEYMLGYLDQFYEEWGERPDWVV